MKPAAKKLLRILAWLAVGLVFAFGALLAWSMDADAQVAHDRKSWAGVALWRVNDYPPPLREGMTPWRSTGTPEELVRCMEQSLVWLRIHQEAAADGSWEALTRWDNVASRAEEAALACAAYAPPAAVAAFVEGARELHARPPPLGRALQFAVMVNRQRMAHSMEAEIDRRPSWDAVTLLAWPAHEMAYTALDASQQDLPWWAPAYDLLPGCEFTLEDLAGLHRHVVTHGRLLALVAQELLTVRTQGGVFGDGVAPPGLERVVSEHGARLVLVAPRTPGEPHAVAVGVRLAPR